MPFRDWVNASWGLPSSAMMMGEPVSRCLSVRAAIEAFGDKGLNVLMQAVL